jgi:hypothetical protein
VRREEEEESVSLSVIPASRAIHSSSRAFCVAFGGVFAFVETASSSAVELSRAESSRVRVHEHELEHGHGHGH